MLEQTISALMPRLQVRHLSLLPCGTDRSKQRPNLPNLGSHGPAQVHALARGNARFEFTTVRVWEAETGKPIAGSRRFVYRLSATEH
jgi:hypothetical protein